MREDNHTTYCRLCLENLNQTEALHLLSPSGLHPQSDQEIDHEPVTLLEQLNKFLPTELDTSKEFSLYVCLSCNSKLEAFEQFIETIVQNQKSLENAPEILVSSEDKETVWEIKLEFDSEDEHVKEEYIEEEEHLIEQDENDNSSNEPLTNSFNCNVCGLSVNTRTGLTLHLRRKHPSEPTPIPKKLEAKMKTRAKKLASSSQYECDFCGTICTSKTGIKLHILKCYKPTDFPRTIKLKENSQAIVKYLKCELCNDEVQFNTFSDLTLHFQEKHDTRGYVRCCDKKFHSRKAVVNHEKLHSGPADFKCQFCGKLLPSQHLLAVHVKLKHADDIPEDSRYCEICKKHLASKCSLYQHNKRFHSNEDKPVCEICGQISRSKEDLKGHIRNKHTQLEKQKCEICGALVKNMRIHRKMHYESTLNIHCEICGHKTTTYKYLKLHMKIHNDEKPFRCDICGQRCKRKTALEDHMSIHSGCPRHFCNYCDRTFNNSGNKYKHIKQAHPNEAAKGPKRKVINPE